MSAAISRRRALFIGAAACALPRLSAAVPTARWQGNALGAHAEIRLAGMTPEEAAPILSAVEAELARLEAIFSLYRRDSALMRLNRDGRLEAPPVELVELLALTQSIHRRSEGLFDPTVQPLFALHARHAAAGTRPGAEEIAAARALIGLGAVEVAPERVAFARPGMGMTLNGVAQGFVTDRIAALMKREGLRDVLVDIGEIRALGDRPTGAGWRVTLADGSHVTLRDRAIASSSVMGTVIGDGVGHIFNPLGAAQAVAAGRTVSVLHASAAVADGFSTAAALMAPGASRALAAGDMEIVWS